MQRSEHSLEGDFFSFHLVGSRDEIQFVSLGSRPLYPSKPSCWPGVLLRPNHPMCFGSCVTGMLIFFLLLCTYTYMTQLLHVHDVVIHRKGLFP